MDYGNGNNGGALPLVRMLDFTLAGQSQNTKQRASILRVTEWSLAELYRQNRGANRR